MLAPRLYPHPLLQDLSQCPSNDSSRQNHVAGSIAVAEDHRHSQVLRWECSSGCWSGGCFCRARRAASCYRRLTRAVAERKIYCREEGICATVGEGRRVRRNASWVPSMVRRRGPGAGGGSGGGMAEGSGYVAVSPAWQMRGVIVCMMRW